MRRKRFLRSRFCEDGTACHLYRFSSGKQVLGPEAQSHARVMRVHYATVNRETFMPSSNMSRVDWLRWIVRAPEHKFCVVAPDSAQESILPERAGPAPLKYRTGERHVRPRFQRCVTNLARRVLWRLHLTAAPTLSGRYSERLRFNHL